MKSATELLVVGNSSTRIAQIAKRLKDQSYHLHIAASLADARARIAEIPADQLVVLSLQADSQTLALLEPHNGFPNFPMLLLIEQDDTAATLKAIKAGAIDVQVDSPAALVALSASIDAALNEWKQRREQQQAIDHAARFGHIIASSLTEIYTFDSETLCFIRINRGAAENVGYSRQELRKMTPLDLKPLLNREQFEELLRPLRLREKEAIRFETLHRRKDGSLYPVEIQLQFADVEPPVFIAVVLDISDRKQAEEKLQASEARFRSIFDTAAAGIAILSPYGEIFDANPYFCEFSGYPKDELIGKNIEDVTHPDDQKTTADYYSTLRQKQKPVVNIEKRYLRKDGQICWGHASVSCVQGRDHNATYCIGLVQDITGHKEAEAKMQAAYSELDAFVHTVAHDLRTPLTPIIGIAEHLRTHAAENFDPVALSLLADIENSGYRLLALLEDLLALARVGHVQQPAAPVDTLRVIDEVLMNLAGPLATAKAEVKVGELSPLRLPETLISQLFDNLIGNAVRYAGATGKPIEVGEERQENHVIFYIRDHGPGIPDDETDHIFEVFYRGETAKQISGTGIGLATVRKITRLYNGDAWVEATPGGGSTFRLKFPISLLFSAAGANSTD